MESSRRDLVNDVTEHRSISKNNQNTFYPRFSFTHKTGLEFPETGVLFLYCVAFFAFFWKELFMKRKINTPENLYEMFF